MFCFLKLILKIVYSFKKDREKGTTTGNLSWVVISSRTAGLYRENPVSKSK